MFVLRNLCNLLYLLFSPWGSPQWNLIIILVFLIFLYLCFLFKIFYLVCNCLLARVFFFIYFQISLIFSRFTWFCICFFFFFFFNEPNQLPFRIRKSISLDSPRSRCQDRIRSASDLLEEIAVKERAEKAGIGRDSMQMQYRTGLW